MCCSLVSGTKFWAESLFYYFFEKFPTMPRLKQSESWVFHFRIRKSNQLFFSVTQKCPACYICSGNVLYIVLSWNVSIRSVSLEYYFLHFFFLEYLMILSALNMSPHTGLCPGSAHCSSSARGHDVTHDREYETHPAATLTHTLWVGRGDLSIHLSVSLNNSPVLRVAFLLPDQLSLKLLMCFESLHICSSPQVSLEFINYKKNPIYLWIIF